MNAKLEARKQLSSAAVQWLTGPVGRALFALLLVIALGIIFNSNGSFFKIGTHRVALRESSVYGLLACGMTLVIITGGIELSVGSVLALVAVCFSLFQIHWGWSPWLGIPTAIAIGGACGLVSGGLVSRLRQQPFIATLAMMVFARGLAKYVSGGKKVTMAVPDANGDLQYVGVPEIFERIDKSILENFWPLAAEQENMSTLEMILDNVSMVTVIFAVCAAFSWIALSRHRWGRQLYAIGGNEEAARLSGVPVLRAKTLAYVACGALAAVAGICQAAQERQGDPEAGVGYELIAIEMVVIGGTNLMGGRGGLGLTLLGVLTIGYLEKILSINSVPEAWRLMLTGVIIAVAVLAQRTRRT